MGDVTPAAVTTTDADGRVIVGDGPGTPVKPKKTLKDKLKSMSKPMMNAIRSARRQIKFAMKDEVIVAATRVRLEPKGFSFIRHPEVDSIAQYFQDNVQEGKRVFNMMFSSSSDFDPTNPLPPCDANEKKTLLEGLQYRLKGLRSEIVVARAKSGDSVSTREMLDHIRRLVSLINGIEATDECRDYDALGRQVKQVSKDSISDENIKRLLRHFAFLVLQGIAPIDGEGGRWKKRSTWAKEFVKALGKAPISKDDWDEYTRDYSAQGRTIPPIIVRVLGDDELIKDLTVKVQMELLNNIFMAIRGALEGADRDEFDIAYPPTNLYNRPSDTIMDVLKWILDKYAGCLRRLEVAEAKLKEAIAHGEDSEAALADARARLAACEAAAAAAAAAGAGGDAAAAAAAAAAAKTVTDAAAAAAAAAAEINRLRGELAAALTARDDAVAAAAATKAELEAQIADKNTEIGQLKANLKLATDSITRFQTQVDTLTRRLGERSSSEADRSTIAGLNAQLAAANAALAAAEAARTKAQTDLAAANARAEKCEREYRELIRDLELLSEAIINDDNIPDLTHIPRLDEIRSKITSLRSHLKSSKTLCLFAYYVNFFITYIFSLPGGREAYTNISGITPDTNYYENLKEYSENLQNEEKGNSIPDIPANRGVINLFKTRFGEHLTGKSDSYIMYLAMFIVTSQKYLTSDQLDLGSLECALPAAILNPASVFNKATRTAPAAPRPAVYVPPLVTPRAVAPTPEARFAAPPAPTPAPRSVIFPPPAPPALPPAPPALPPAPPAPRSVTPPAPRSVTPPAPRSVTPPASRSATPEPLVLPKATGITYAADAITEEQAEEALNAIKDIIKAAKRGRITHDNRTDYLKYKHILDSYCSYGDNKHPLTRYPEPNRAICYQYGTTKSYKLPSER